MHVGGRSAPDIDAGSVLPTFFGVLVRDGYAGHEHPTGALLACCGAHLLRDLRSISDAHPGSQIWANAMADTLLRSATPPTPPATQASAPSTWPPWLVCATTISARSPKEV